MPIEVITFAEAFGMPLVLPKEWDDPNLRYCISSELRQRILYEGIDQIRLEEPITGFDGLATEIERQFVTVLTAPYHDADHARGVAQRFARYLEAGGESETIQRLGLIAGLFHDAGHPGQRYREDAAGTEHPELSNEEFAAALCVTYLKDRLNTTQLAWLWSVIIATSFGQKRGADPEVNAALDARPHLVRPYEPFTEHQLLLHLADVNCTEGPDGYEAFTLNGVKFMRETAGEEPLAWNAAQKLVFGRRQDAFLGYVLASAERVKHFFHESSFAETLLREIAEVKGKLRCALTVWSAEALMDGMEGS